MLGGKAQAAFKTLPALMQVVQTFIRCAPPWGFCTRIDCRFGSKRRLVRLFACETLLPNCGPLPQTSQRLAIIVQPPDSKTKFYNKRISMSSSREPQVLWGCQFKGAG